MSAQWSGATIATVDEGWARLGARIRTERSRRWRTRAEFSRASGVAVRVLADLENGARDNYLETTLAAVEAALGWAPGAAHRVVQGGRVRRDLDPEMARVVAVWPHLSSGTRRMLAELAERSAER